jgi:predicted DNA-binding protein
MTTRVFATKLPGGLIEQLGEVCRMLGLRKNHLVEEAIREKIEDLLDSYDLRQAVKETTGFHSWDSVRKELR